MFSLSPEQSVIIVLVGLVAALSACLWFRRDTDQENRRRGYIALMGVLKELGLVRMADVALDAGVGDISGLCREGLAIAKEFDNPEKMMALLSESFYKQLPNRLKRPEDQVKIFAAVDETKQALSKPRPVV